MVKRAVRVKSQLKSHKSFANAFPKYCELVDNAKLYCTNSVGGPPRVKMSKSMSISEVTTSFSFTDTDTHVSVLLVGVVDSL